VARGWNPREGQVSKDESPAENSGVTKQELT
jgi:hypothetical protein